MVNYGNTLGTGSTNLFGVFEVLEEGTLVPGYALIYVGGSVRVAIRLTSLTTEDSECQHINNVNFRTSSRDSPMEIRSNLMGSTSLNRVALSASSLEETSTLRSVTC